MTEEQPTSLLIGTESDLYRIDMAQAAGDNLLVARTVDGPQGRVDALTSDRWGLYALVGGRSLWRQVDAQALGRHVDGRWVQVAEVEDPPGRCLLATEDGLYVGTAEAHLLHLEDGFLQRMKGFDDAPGRDTWYTPWGGPPDTRTMSQGPDGTLYANVHVGGILRSPDGERWAPTIDVDADVHDVLAHPEEAEVVLAACAPGLGISHDRGDTWSIHHDGLHGRYCRAVAVAGEDVLVSASTGPFTDRAALYRRPLDGEGPFEKVVEGLPEWFPSNIDSLCLAAEGATAVFGTSEGEVYRSGDGGRTWERTATGLAEVRGILLA
jgi:hypothetical protein